MCVCEREVEREREREIEREIERDRARERERERQREREREREHLGWRAWSILQKQHVRFTAFNLYAQIYTHTCMQSTPLAPT